MRIPYPRATPYLNLKMEIVLQSWLSSSGWGTHSLRSCEWRVTGSPRRLSPILAVLALSAWSDIAARGRPLDQAQPHRLCLGAITAGQDPSSSWAWLSRRATGVKVRFKFGPVRELTSAMESKAHFDLLFTDDTRGYAAGLLGARAFDKDTLTGVAILPLILATEPEKRPRSKCAKGLDLSRGQGKNAARVTRDGSRKAPRPNGAERFGWLEALKPRLGTVPDGRSVKLLDKGAADAAIIYATDLAFSESLEQVAQFPPETHDPIVLTAALSPELPAGRSESFSAFSWSPRRRAI